MIAVPLWRDRGVQADRPAADSVELTFNEEEAAAFFKMRACVIHPEQDAAFVENLRFGRVDVFGIAGWIVCGGLLQLTCGKGDDAPLHIANRHHESAAEA